MGDTVLALGVLVPVGGGDDIVLRKAELSVGRSEHSDIVLRFSNVSGRHCTLVLDHGYWYVLDKGSTNGVRVNRLRVTDRRIDPGDRVSFAGHDYYLQYDPLANGAMGVIPPDSLVNDIFEKSLMERAGLVRRGQGNMEPKNTAPIKRRTIDYESLGLDDIDFS